MLDNFTNDMLCEGIHQEGIEGAVCEYGRVAVIDNPELENAWDKLVQSYNTVLFHYLEYVNRPEEE